MNNVTNITSPPTYSLYADDYFIASGDTMRLVIYLAHEQLKAALADKDEKVGLDHPAVAAAMMILNMTNRKHGLAMDEGVLWECFAQMRARESILNQRVATLPKTGHENAASRLSEWADDTGATATKIRQAILEQREYQQDALDLPDTADLLRGLDEMVTDALKNYAKKEVTTNA